MTRIERILVLYNSNRSIPLLRRGRRRRPGWDFLKLKFFGLTTPPCGHSSGGGESSLEPINMKNIVIVTGLLLLASCSKTNTEIITAHQWKHGGGYPVAGDWIDFSREAVIFSNDTLYNNNTPVAVTDSITTHYGEYHLHLKSLSGKGSGIYVEKGKK
jgi:hypothetical protein